MTEPTHAGFNKLEVIDDLSTDNTNGRLIEMNAIDRAEPHANDIANMRSVDVLEMVNVEDGTGSVSEVDGRRKTRAIQTQSYDIHKGIAESAMDISLLTANANQLRLLISYNVKSATFTVCIVLVISSLVLQILVACGVIIVKSYPKSKPNRNIHKLKVCTSILVSIITVINILVASLVITDK